MPCLVSIITYRTNFTLQHIPRTVFLNFCNVYSTVCRVDFLKKGLDSDPAKMVLIPDLCNHLNSIFNFITQVENKKNRPE